MSHDIPHLLRVTMEGKYEEMIEFAKEMSANGWSPAKTQVLEQTFGLRLVQLISKGKALSELSDLNHAIDECILIIRRTNPELAERLAGFTLIADQAMTMI